MMHNINRFVRIIDNVNMYIAKVTGFLVIVIASVLFFGVVMRYLFNQALTWEGDVAWLLFVWYSVMVGGYVLRIDSHVRVDVLYEKLGSKGKAIIDVSTFIIFLLFICVMIWFSVKKAWWSVTIFERSSYSTFHAPIFPARICLALGSISLLLQGVAEFICNILIITGKKIEGRVK